jgi:hypothetical protein
LRKVEVENGQLDGPEEPERGTLLREEMDEDVNVRDGWEGMRMELSKK